jgi:hypothetical protein
MKALRQPATIISILALGVALTGTASAITMISGAQIKNGTITGNKLKNYTIPGVKIANGTITGNKVANRTIPGMKIANGTITSTQVANHTLEWTKLSNDVLAGLNYWEDSPAQLGTIAANTRGVVQATCPADAYRAVGGSFFLNSNLNVTGVTVVSSNRWATTGGNGWEVTVQNDSGSPKDVTVVATCVY